MGVSGSEILLILIVVYLLFGSKKLPEVARGLSKGLGQIKKASDDIKREFMESGADIISEVRNVQNDLKNQVEQEVKNSSEEVKSSLDEVKQTVSNATEIPDTELKG
jgi:sec-independent protein translocase protein TatA